MVPKSYDQYCPVAEALDLVGERWTLLIVRELTYGPQRFTDLRVGLPGIPPNLLASRLRELEDGGIVRRRDLPAPAARSVYELTEEGRGLEPTLRALARWGIHRLPPPDEGEVSPLAAVRGRAGRLRPAAGGPGRRRGRGRSMWATRCSPSNWPTGGCPAVEASRTAPTWSCPPARPTSSTCVGARTPPSGAPPSATRPSTRKLVAEFEAVFDISPSRERRDRTEATH